MATLATILDRFAAPKSVEQPSPRTRVLEEVDPFEVPPFPNEDVYFYVKRIDNSHVLRESDPAARKVCWRLIGSSFAIAVVVIGLLLPTLYGLIAGYRMEALRQERQRLDLDRASLELAEAKLLSPARLEELAKMQQFIDPAPQKVVYLDEQVGAEVGAALGAPAREDGLKIRMDTLATRRVHVLARAGIRLGGVDRRPSGLSSRSSSTASIKRLAQQQQEKIVELQAPRGAIVDRLGQRLAMSLPVESVCVDPLQVPDLAVAADILSKILNVDAEDLVRESAVGRR